MGIDIKINIELTPTQKKFDRGAVVAGAVIGALGIGIAIADPVPFASQESLSSAKMNSNFDDLNGRLHAVEAIQAKETADGGYSLGATFCDKTATTPGDLSLLSAAGASYQKARAACQALSACGATGHMCAADEIVRSVERGSTVPAGWMATATFSQSGGNPVRDCKGWVSTAGTEYGADWFIPSGVGYADVTSCAATLPLLCCN